MNEHEPRTPEDLLHVETALDRLGQRARDAAPSDLEARCIAAASKAADSGDLRLVGEGAPRAASRTHASPIWRAAAAIAVLATVVGAGVWMTTLNTPTAPVADAADTDDVSIQVAAYLDEAPDGAAAEALRDLDTELATLESALGAEWSLDDTLWLEDSL